jgi:hypothetical protein
MANCKEGFWRISLILSTLGLLWGLSWSGGEWPRILKHRQFVSRFERQVQSLRLKGERWNVPPTPDGFELVLPAQKLNVPDFGTIEFPEGMTASQIRKAILQSASADFHITKPAWYWYASLVTTPLLASLLPLALYRILRWVVGGFEHAGK